VKNAKPKYCANGGNPVGARGKIGLLHDSKYTQVSNLKLEKYGSV
jgi:hypothetical protein